MKMGTAKRPEEMKLHYGIGQINAGKKAAGLATLKTVKGTNGEADVARYFVLQNKG